jgi:hypothetical protein
MLSHVARLLTNKLKPILSVCHCQVATRFHCSCKQATKTKKMHSSIPPPQSGNDLQLYHSHTLKHNTSLLYLTLLCVYYNYVCFTVTVVHCADYFVSFIRLYFQFQMLIHKLFNRRANACSCSEEELQFRNFKRLQVSMFRTEFYQFSLPVNYRLCKSIHWIHLDIKRFENLNQDST